MRKIWLSVSLFLLSAATVSAQVLAPDSVGFKSRKLKFQEINFVSSYYNQDGNNSAVTGGIGTEKLTDVAAIFDIAIKKTDLKNRQHSVRLGVGVEHYTSASSDKINPNTISSASAADQRIFPSLKWSMRDEQKRYAVGAGVMYSTEFDYKSKGGTLSLARFSEDNNREFSLSLTTYLDTWLTIYPVELRKIQTDTGPIPNPDARGTKPRNSYNASVAYSQVINKRMQMAVIADLTYQTGQLGTLFHRVYFADSTVHVERLPDTRIKIPVGLRFNYFATDRLVVRSLYRFYSDNWGIIANSVEVELPYKITPFVSVSPFYRFYVQSAANYFAPYRAHGPDQQYYTSDFDLSDFTSHLQGINLRFISAEGLLGIPKFYSFDLRYGYYLRSNNLHANSITIVATFK